VYLCTHARQKLGVNQIQNSNLEIHQILLFLSIIPVTHQEREYLPILFSLFHLKSSDRSFLSMISGRPSTTAVVDLGLTTCLHTACCLDVDASSPRAPSPPSTGPKAFQVFRLLIKESAVAILTAG
jgi:hypothetical protein